MDILSHFDVMITLLKLSLTLSSRKGLLKIFSTAEEQKLKFQPYLRQIDSEWHAKYGYSTPNMKRDTFKK